MPRVDFGKLLFKFAHCLFSKILFINKSDILPLDIQYNTFGVNSDDDSDKGENTCQDNIPVEDYLSDPFSASFMNETPQKLC